MLTNTFLALLYYCVVVVGPALLTTAAPLPSAILEAKDVGILTCETTHTAPLYYFNTTDSGPLSFTGPTSPQGLPLLHTTRSSGSKVSSHLFVFQRCTSNKPHSFMGDPPSNANINGIGHIELFDQPGKCITADFLHRPEGKIHAQFVLQPCSFSDDSSQLFQTFARRDEASGNSQGQGQVDFLGHRQGMGPEYELSISQLQYGTLLVKRLIGAEAAADGLRLKFESEAILA